MATPLSPAVPETLRPPLPRILLVWGLCLLLFFALRSLTGGMGTGDSVQYTRVAEAVGQATEAPYAYRIAMPYAAAGLARVLNLPLDRAFFALQVVCFASLATVLYFFLSSAFPERTSLPAMGVWLFAFSYSGSYSVHNTSHIGFAEHLVLICGFWSVHRRALLATAGFVMLAAMVKEPAACMILGYHALRGVPAWRDRAAWLRHLARTAVLAGALVAALALPRLLLEPMRQTGSFVDYYLNPALWQRIWYYYGGPVQSFWQAFLTFGPLWACAAAGFLLAPGERRAAWWVLLSLLQMFFATDVQRVVGCAFPAILLFALTAVRRVPPELRWLIPASQTLYFIAQNHGFGLGAALILSCLVLLVAAAFWLAPLHPPLAARLRGASAPREDGA